MLVAVIRCVEVMIGGLSLLHTLVMSRHELSRCTPPRYPRRNTMHALIINNKPFHQHRIVGGHARGAPIGVALKGLDAPKCVHHRTSGVHEVGTESQALDDAEPGENLE